MDGVGRHDRLNVGQEVPSRADPADVVRVLVALASGSVSRCQPLVRARATAHRPRRAADPAAAPATAARAATAGPHSTPASPTTTGSSTRPVSRRSGGPRST